MKLFVGNHKSLRQLWSTPLYWILSYQLSHSRVWYINFGKELASIIHSCLPSGCKLEDVGDDDDKGSLHNIIVRTIIVTLTEVFRHINNTIVPVCSTFFSFEPFTYFQSKD